MKHWKCPKCHTERKFKYGYDEKLILKICGVDLEQMEVVDE